MATIKKPMVIGLLTDAIIFGLWRRRAIETTSGLFSERYNSSRVDVGQKRHRNTWRKQRWIIGWRYQFNSAKFPSRRNYNWSSLILWKSVCFWQKNSNLILKTNTFQFKIGFYGQSSLLENSKNQGYCLARKTPPSDRTNMFRFPLLAKMSIFSATVLQKQGAGIQPLTGYQYGVHTVPYLQES